MLSFILAALISSSIIMAAAFWVAKKTNSSGFIDAIWALNIGIISTITILFSKNNLKLASILLLAIIFIWSYRLSSHLFKRSIGNDDPRYAQLKTEWGKKANLYLFLFLQIQAICATILILSIYLFLNRDNINSINSFIGLFIAIFALIIETKADNQLKEFSRQYKGQNEVCDIGLWKYSRHPNYFAEFLFWLGIAFASLDFSLHNPASFIAISAPIMMYYLLVYASGIPPLEAHMLRTRGEKFKKYQANTSPFFPKFKN